jgi:hypothetical protein
LIGHCTYDDKNHCSVRPCRDIEMVRYEIAMISTCEAVKGSMDSGAKLELNFIDYRMGRAYGAVVAET